MARDIHAFAAGRTILDAAVSFGPILETDPARLKTDLVGRKVERAWRMGKWVIIDLVGGGAVLFQLKMTGQFMAEPWPGCLSPSGEKQSPAAGTVSPGKESLSRTPQNKSGSKEAAVSKEKVVSKRRAISKGKEISKEDAGHLSSATLPNAPLASAPLPSAALSSEPWPPHCHFAILLDGDPQEALFYKDVRKFGRVRVLSDSELAAFLEKHSLGPDALEITADVFHARLTSKRISLKAALLDQSLVSGFGNIYADESLFAARLSPKSRAAQLSRQQAETLLEKAKAIMALSIEMRGSTVINYQSLGERGSYQMRHQVYGKGGQPCPVCGTDLDFYQVSGRSTVSCPKCQP